MNAHIKLLAALAVAVSGAAVAQTATERTRDAANAVGRAASAAVTPGDQNMGRTPENRSGGLMGKDGVVRETGSAAGRAAGAAVTPGDQNMGRNPDNRSGGLMGNDAASGGTDASGARAARADRN